MRVARIERGVEIDHRLEISQCAGGKLRVGVRAIQIAAESEAESQVAIGSRVKVCSDIAAMENILLRAFEDIRPGNALMYFPEANVLVPRSIDPISKTPAFKSLTVRIEPMSNVDRVAV